MKASEGKGMEEVTLDQNSKSNVGAYYSLSCFMTADNRQILFLTPDP